MTRNARPVEEQYSPARAAELLGVDESTLWRWIKAKKIQPVYKLGHRLTRIPASAVNTFLEARKIAA